MAGHQARTVLGAIADERGWDFPAFETQFRAAAARLAKRTRTPTTADLTVSIRTYLRWRTYGETTAPRNPCRAIIEELFGLPAHTLFAHEKTRDAALPADNPQEAGPDETRRAEPRKTDSRLPSPEVDRLLGLAAPRRIKPATLRAIEALIPQFWHLDDRFGSEPVRPVVIAQLRYGQDLLHECRNTTERRQLLALTAELARLSGWLCFDARKYSTARTYYEESLRLAGELEDPAFTANVLASLSLQATYEGHAPADAVALARAAQDTCRFATTPRVMAMLCMREAFAHAAAHNTRDCLTAIAEARRHLERADAADSDPAWVAYFTDQKLLVDTGIALSRLGDVAAATELLTQAVAAAEPADARNYAFHTFWLAGTLLKAGRLDEACAAASRTLAAAEDIDSPRVAGHIRDLRAQMIPHQKSPLAADFLAGSEALLQEAGY